MFIIKTRYIQTKVKTEKVWKRTFWWRDISQDFFHLLCRMRLPRLHAFCCLPIAVVELSKYHAMQMFCYRRLYVSFRTWTLLNLISIWYLD